MDEYELLKSLEFDDWKVATWFRPSEPIFEFLGMQTAGIYMNSKQEQLLVIVENNKIPDTIHFSPKCRVSSFMIFDWMLQWARKEYHWKRRKDVINQKITIGELPKDYWKGYAAFGKLPETPDSLSDDL